MELQFYGSEEGEVFFRGGRGEGQQEGGKRKSALLLVRKGGKVAYFIEIKGQKERKE